MSFRRPRLRPQPNMVARQAAREPAPAPEPPPPEPQSAAAPTAEPQAAERQPAPPADTPAVEPKAADVKTEPVAKARVTLPSRFKRMAPRLDVGRTAESPAAPAPASPGPAPSSPAPAHAAAAAPAAAPAAPAAARPRPSLPSRFKRMAPRLTAGRAPGASRPDGAGAPPTEGSTAEKSVQPPASPISVAPLTAAEATEAASEAAAEAASDRAPKPASCAAPETPGAAPETPGAAPEAAEAAECPAPSKRPRLDSARLPAEDPDDPDDLESADPDDPEPTESEDPDSAPQRPAAEPRQPARRGAQPEPRGAARGAGEEGVKAERVVKMEIVRKPEREPAQQPATGMELVPFRPAEDDPEEGEGEEPLLSETDLTLRKRFNAPRPKSSSWEILNEIRQRVADNMPIRNKMMMKDLIYWNPSTEAMSNSKEKQNKRRKRRDSTSSVLSCQTNATEDSLPADDPAPEPEPEPEPKPEEPDDAMPVPQLKVGPDGSIVIDEQSLVVKTSQQKQRDQELSTDLVCDVTGSRLSFNGYRQRRQINEWSIRETARFYKALSTVGTDFSIMEQLFPKRSRVDLKKKFKKEERKNPHLIERALRQDMQYDLTIFDNDVWESTVQQCKTLAQAKRQAAREAKRQERENDARVLKKERAARRTRQARPERATAGKAASLLDSLMSPASRRRKPAGRENARPPPPSGGPAPAQPAAPHLNYGLMASGFDLAKAEPAAPGAGGPAPPPGTGELAGGVPWPPPGGVLQLPPGINPQNLLIIASPSPDRPDGQVLHVYMVQPPADGAAPLAPGAVPLAAGAAPGAMPMVMGAGAMPMVMGGGVMPMVAGAGAVPMVTGAGAAGAGPKAGPKPLEQVLGIPWAVPVPVVVPGEDAQLQPAPDCGTPAAEQKVSVRQPAGWNDEVMAGGRQAGPRDGEVAASPPGGRTQGETDGAAQREGAAESGGGVPGEEVAGAEAQTTEDSQRLPQRVENQTAERVENQEAGRLNPHGSGTAGSLAKGEGSQASATAGQTERLPSDRISEATVVIELETEVIQS